MPIRVSKNRAQLQIHLLLALPGLFLVLWAMGLQSCTSIAVKRQIPKDDYKTWSLFLICDPFSLDGSEKSKANLLLLHEKFVGFGNAIGHENAAIWFLTRNSVDFGDYDGERAADYCGKYNVMSSESPAIVLTTEYPSLGTPSGNNVKVSLNGLDNTDSYNLLGLLADQVRSSELDQQKIDSQKYWLVWERILKSTLAAAGKVAHGVTVEVDTAVLKFTIRGKDIS
jgi:hypothetical protein